MSRVLHVVPGTGDVSNGMAVVARFLAREQENGEIVDLSHGLSAIDASVDEVWVHGLWLPQEWAICMKALRRGKRLVRMTHGSLSPVYLANQGKRKKRLVAPMEKWLLRHCERIVATCEAERDWIASFLGDNCPSIDIIRLQRFFRFKENLLEPLPQDRPLHLLYLGRRHPLKGIEYLEAAVASLPNVELHIASDVCGEEKERAWEWCDVLVLPTLSDNFGLVIAEALERGKRVITTDGAPAWSDDNIYGGRLTYIKGYRDATSCDKVKLLTDAIASQME